MDFSLRAASPEDEDDLVQIWALSFGDEPGLIRRLLFEIGLIKNATVAQYGGHVRSAMFSYDGLDFGGVSGSYIYALCTHPDFRGLGMGAAVVGECVRQAQLRGAQVVCLHPASDSLGEWYARVIGSVCLSRSRELTVPATDGDCRLTPVSAAEYGALRGDCAPRMSKQLLSTQAVFCSTSGGALFRVESQAKHFAACVEYADGAAMLKDLSCPPVQVPALAATIAGNLGLPEITVRVACAPEQSGTINLAGVLTPGTCATGQRSFFLPLILD